MGERLVRVESFDELRVGMRVVVTCTVCDVSCHSLLVRFIGADCMDRVFGVAPTEDCWLDEPLHFHGGGDLPCAIYAETVERGLVFRFADDINIDAELSAEANPYLERSTVGTGGRDEVRVAAKERAR